jgi:hypothetical protein
MMGENGPSSMLLQPVLIHRLRYGKQLEGNVAHQTGECKGEGAFSLRM